MRKIVEIVGIGMRKTGTGAKAGKAYDFTPVAIAYEDDFFVGKKCETVNIDQAVIGDRELAVGQTLELVTHQFNFKTYVDLIV